MRVTSKVFSDPVREEEHDVPVGMGLGRRKRITRTASAPKKEIRHAEKVAFSPLSGDQRAVGDLDARVRARRAPRAVREAGVPVGNAALPCCSYFSHLSSIALLSPASRTFFRPALMTSRTFVLPFFTATP